MSKRDHILYMLGVNRDIAKRLLDDITEEESMKRIDDTSNHIRWFTGHLTFCLQYIGQLLGDKPIDEATYGKLYGTGSQVSDDAGLYPSFAELRKTFYDTHDHTRQVVERAAEDAFDKKTGGNDGRDTVWKMITFLCMHEFYHNGQISDVRRALGRDRTFG